MQANEPPKTEIAQDPTTANSTTDPKGGVDPKAAALLKVADTVAASGDTIGAIGLYEKLLNQYPKLNKARTALGEMLLDKGDAALALHYFDEAKTADPNDPQNYVGAGRAQMALNKIDKARDLFKEALTKDPNNVSALIGLGVAFDSRAKHAEAQKNYRKVLALDPSNKPARNNLGLSLALSGQHKQAIAELVPLANDEGPVGRKARQNISLSYGMQGDFVAASKWSKVDLKRDDVKNDLFIYGSVGLQ